jgi:6-phosphogluconolactonase
MTTKVVPGQLVAVADASAVATNAAARIGKALREAIVRSGAACIALSGGNTPRAAYALLAKDTSIDWSKVDVYWVDERVCAPTDDRSNYFWAKSTLLDGARLAASSVWRMPTDSRDLERAAESYEALLRARVRPASDGLPAFDVVVLGVGDDGHTASLFPGEPAVHEQTRLVVAVPANGAREARMTITPPVIERAVATFVLATGSAKAAPLDRAWNATGTLDETPSRVVRTSRGAVTWVIDRAAGGLEA